MTDADLILAGLPAATLHDIVKRHKDEKAAGWRSPTMMEEITEYVRRFHQLNPHLWREDNKLCTD